MGTRITRRAKAALKAYSLWEQEDTAGLIWMLAKGDEAEILAALSCCRHYPLTADSSLVPFVTKRLNHSSPETRLAALKAFAANASFNPAHMLKLSCDPDLNVVNFIAHKLGNMSLKYEHLTPAFWQSLASVSNSRQFDEGIAHVLHFASHQKPDVGWLQIYPTALKFAHHDNREHRSCAINFLCRLFSFAMPLNAQDDVLLFINRIDDYSMLINLLKQFGSSARHMLTHLQHAGLLAIAQMELLEADELARCHYSREQYQYCIEAEYIPFADVQPLNAGDGKYRIRKELTDIAIAHMDSLLNDREYDHDTHTHHYYYLNRAAVFSLEDWHQQKARQAHIDITHPEANCRRRALRVACLFELADLLPEAIRQSTNDCPAIAREALTIIIEASYSKSFCDDAAKQLAELAASRTYPHRIPAIQEVLASYSSSLRPNIEQLATSLIKNAEYHVIEACIPTRELDFLSGSTIARMFAMILAHKLPRKHLVGLLKSERKALRLLAYLSILVYSTSHPDAGKKFIRLPRVWIKELRRALEHTDLEELDAIRHCIGNSGWTLNEIHGLLLPTLEYAGQHARESAAWLLAQASYLSECSVWTTKPFTPQRLLKPLFDHFNRIPTRILTEPIVSLMNCDPPLKYLIRPEWRPIIEQHLLRIASRGSPAARKKLHKLPGF